MMVVLNTGSIEFSRGWYRVAGLCDAVWRIWQEMSMLDGVVKKTCFIKNFKCFFSLFLQEIIVSHFKN